MSGLLFKEQELRNELGSLMKLATPLLDRSTAYVLNQLDSDLRSVFSTCGGATLEISRDRPLRTRVSVGELEPPAKRRGRRIYGEVTGKWEVALKKGGRKNKTKWLELCGLASTVIKLFDEGKAEPIAVWKVELGDPDAPGCYFHIHAGALSEDLPVPRHPSLFVTPMAAIAFMLGEIFQGEWDRVVSRDTYDSGRWRTIQKQRLTALLEWKLRAIANTESSPWLSLKAAKPPADLFSRSRT